MTSYFPSTAWLRSEADALREGLHHPNRTLLAGGTRLTVPVEGGVRRLRGLKEGDAMPDMRVSDHGRWPHVHLGAIETLYSSAPYFDHYFPGVERLLRRAPESFAELCAGSTRLLLEGVDAEKLLPALSCPSEAVREESERLRKEVDDRLSFLDPLFRFGPQAIFLLVRTF